MNDKTLKRYSEIKEIAQKGGYHLNPDEEMTIALIDGLVVNNERYKDEVCPCRLFRGTLEDNLDIVCPCYYRDDDLAEYGACFCGLYVTQEVIDSGGPEAQVPERRLSLKERQKKAEENNKTDLGGLSHPVWRCSVCGYLCANTNAPSVCPICKAKRERFERFI
jgi:ferredoxin-thioredoxin reductase catalytic subunit/rubredoxin